MIESLRSLAGILLGLILGFLFMVYLFVDSVQGDTCPKPNNAIFANYTEDKTYD